ncbi:MAG: UvrD-helicase domain-containing protein [Candidatus Eiseniibacteriota bacterium]
MRPPDQDVRDRIVSARGVTLAVEAGAGTGKTRLLVDRVLSRLRDGVPLPRLAVITFTKKAAAELVARIRSDLAERRAEPWARSALSTFDLAEIGTTDSFCWSLLSRHPLEAGVPPGFGVADEIAAEALRDVAWSRFLDGQGAEGGRSLAALRRSGVKVGALRSLLEALVSERDLDVAAIETHTVPELAPEFSRALDAALALAGLCRDPRDRLWLRVRELERERDAASLLDRAAAERLLARRKAAGARYGSRRDGRAEAWGGKHGKAKVVAALEQVDEAVDRWFRARGLALAAETVDLAKAYGREYARVKLERGLLDFRDLALVTRNLLRDRADVRRRVAARFDEVFLDEVQDTDPLQMEIAFLLAAAGEGRITDPLAAELVPGRLFLVGDPKQSIYRFRRADIELYERAVSGVAARGETPRIRANFRSRPEILDFTNRVFRGWMEPPEDGTRWQVRYEELEAAVPGAPDANRVRLLLPDARVRAAILERAGRDSLRAEDVRELELDSVVRLVRRVVGADGEPAWIVRDPRSRAERPARARDVAVLVRKIDWGERLLDALRHAGVGATTSGGRRYWEREEIQSLLAVLEAVVDPENRLAHFAALRSLAFGLPDDALVLHVLDPQEGTPAASCDDRLRELTLHARKVPPAEFLEHVVEELCLLPVFGLRPDGAGRVESLRMLLESADSLAEAGLDSLPDLVRWLRERSGEGAAEAPGEFEPGEGGGVQILTMHKAKGLEFPVVILADLAAEPRQDSLLVADRASGLVEFRASRPSGVQTAAFEEAYRVERDRRRAEDVRLLYVAMTRARDWLVLSWPQGSGGFLEGGVLAERVGAPPGEAPPGGVPSMRAEELAALPERRRLLRIDPERPRIPVEPPPDSWREARAAAARGSRIVAATRLGSRAEPTYSGAPGSGAIFGRLVHGALERLDPLDPARAGRALALAATDLERALAREGMRLDPALVGAAASLLERIAAEPAVLAVWNAPRLLREVPFLIPRGDDFLSGTFDALLEELDGALTLVDWKTERIGDEPGESAKERHRDQAALYAWAAVESTGRPVREVRIVFLASDPVRTGSFAVGPELLDGARRLLGASGWSGDPVPGWR